MHQQIQAIKKTREHLLRYISDVTLDGLNEVPAGFNNNIIWNMGHIIASQQGVCYLRAGLEPVVEKSLYLTYKPDTKPEGYAESAEVDKLRELLLSTMDRFEEDYGHNLFQHYPVWTTRYGVELSTIDDTISFLQFHEGLHIGYIMALKRLVAK